MVSTHSGSCLLALMLFCAASAAGASASFEQRLLEANGLRSSNPQRFAILLDKLESASQQATPVQRQGLQYLRAYQSVVYRNQVDVGIAQAKALYTQTTDTDLKFRTGSLLANSYALNRNFTEGLRYLNQTLPMRHRVRDRNVRHDGIDSAAVLYNQMGQYKLGLKYAQETLADDPNPRARCLAGLFQAESQHYLDMLPADDAPIHRDIERCIAAGEPMAANFIRVVLVQKWAARGETDMAIELLEQHLAEVDAIGYHFLIAQVRSLLAELKLGKGDLDAAKAHAEGTTALSRQVASSLSLVTAYKVLHEVANRRGDLVAALELYRRYAEADKAHLSDVKARELAYEIVRHETLQKTQQIELLKGENQLLQLQQRIDQQGAQNTRLLMLLLGLLVAGISYWAYKVKSVQMSLRRFAETDSLTGISNRHHFTQQSGKALAQSAQSGEACALVMFDLDHFKTINDSYGHDTGDWVLQQVAKTCKGLCRRIDYFGRLGGEEFAVLLQGIDLQAATRLAEDCRVRLAQIDTRESGYAFVVTASFGVTATALSGYTLAKLLSDADQMLYRAKRSGRNRVLAFTGEPVSAPLLHVVPRGGGASPGGAGSLGGDAAESLGS